MGAIGGWEARTGARRDRVARAGTDSEIGGGAGTRTPDTEIMILLLYQLSYTAREGAKPQGMAGEKNEGRGPRMSTGRLLRAAFPAVLVLAPRVPTPRGFRWRLVLVPNAENP